MSSGSDPCVTRHPPWVSCRLLCFDAREAGAGRRTLRPPGKAVGTRAAPLGSRAEGKGGARRGHREPTDNGIPGTKNNNQVFAFISRVPAAASGSRAEGGAPHGARPGLRTAQVGPRAGSAYRSRVFPVPRRVPSGSAKRSSKSLVRWEGWGRRRAREITATSSHREAPRVRAPLPLTWRSTRPLGRPPLPRGREGFGDARSAPGQET